MPGWAVTSMGGQGYDTPLCHRAQGVLEQDSGSGGAMVLEGKRRSTDICSGKAILYPTVQRIYHNLSFKGVAFERNAVK